MAKTSVSGDLLQQAFQQVIDEDESPPDLMNILGNSDDDNQVIQLSAEQAAALGITFKIVDEPQEVEQQQSLVENDSQRIISELTQSGLFRPSNEDGVDFEWTVQETEPQDIYQDETINANNVSVNDNLNQCQNNTTSQDLNNIQAQIQSNEQNNFGQQDFIRTTISQCNGNDLQNTVQLNIPQSTLQTNVSETQAQILQRYPIILPSSQLIFKPAQTVLTPVKSIRILSNNSSKTQTSQNSLLLPKTNVINTISPQIIKAMPVGTHFMSTANNISMQMLNTSRIIPKTCDSSNSNKLINEPHNTINIGNISTLGHNMIRQSSVQKSVPAQIQQKTNLQQYFGPILKTNCNIVASKNTLLHSNTIKHTVSNPLLKSIQCPAQSFKTTNVKSPLIAKNSNTPIIFRTTPVMKHDNARLITESSSTTKLQTVSSPVSLLKPQTKVANNSLTTQNIVNVLQSTQKTPLVKLVQSSEGLKPLVTAKLKQNVNSLMKAMKKKPISQNPISLKSDAPDPSKPLGSSENPIQIVQQGNSYHSMQRLSQAQLKHIAQLLQQRKEETNSSNEKVVYRLVFPDDIDSKMKNSNSLLKNKAGKRGRPKKSAIKTSISQNKLSTEEEHDDSKDERKKIVARTRSGRLSRPPRHMVRDYKHLHHLDFTQPDLDDSDGGYSDYNTNGSGKTEEEDGSQRTELLAGLEMPKRKISDHFRCPTCNKIYLGRTRMSRHFEMHPDHGSPDQLPPPTPDPELKTPALDTLKRKGKKRGPWAYVTPEAKSERRQQKLQEAISVCEGSEIVKIAGKPVANSLSLYDLLLLKSDNNVHTFLSEIKEFIDRIREKSRSIFSPANHESTLTNDVIDLSEDALCETLNMRSGFYQVNETLSFEESETNVGETFDIDNGMEPPLKRQKTDDILEEGKENIEERLSSGFSESSDLSVSEFLNDRRNDPSANCPEVLSALTLVPRNNCSNSLNDVTKVNNVSKVLNSGAEVQTTDNPGFQKLSINVASNNSSSFLKEGEFTKLGDSLDSSCTDVFTKLNGSYEQAKMDNMQNTFIKLEPTEDGFIKLGNGMLNSFHQEMEDFGKIQSNGFHFISASSTDSFNEGFRKLIPKKMDSNEEELKSDDSNHHENTIQITTNCSNHSPDSNIFDGSHNLDISKMENYDHITHLDILNSSSGIDKNLMIDEKLVEHLHLVDSSNIDDIVSERLKSILPENLLESNLLNGNSHLDADLDFDELSEEFNRNTRS
ncbi:uncharacterized protein LOC131673977 [Phymastichus coffea]|uniref:uncharacterized protein LOC131673977 n=1 Tax=Phymastichus coffea TaxID=108790 RepID=UPI00273BF2FD|nr:uncharacterized protein LOC131673977 [Phymastichus coffea]